MSPLLAPPVLRRKSLLAMINLKGAQITLPANVPHLWQHGLDVAPPVLRENEVLGAPRLALLLLRLLCEHEQLGVLQPPLGVKHKLLRDLVRLLVRLLIVVLIFLLLQQR